MADAKSTEIGMLLFPKMTQLDLTGPYEVFARMPLARVHLLWKDTAPVTTDRGMQIVPSMTLADCPKLDIIMVPGGPGQEGVMEDAIVLDFLRRQAAGARYVVSVCTGSLVLAAAGLLNGYRSTCHWSAIDLLPVMGAIPTDERVVVDRNRISGAGVSAGIDCALRVASILHGPQVAQEIQLQIEYDPQPPFDSGSVRKAPKAVLDTLRARGRSFHEQRQATAARVAARAPG